MNYISNKYNYCRWVFIKRNKDDIVSSFSEMRDKLKKRQRPIIYVENYKDNKIMIRNNIDTIESYINVSISKLPKHSYIEINFDDLITNTFKEVNKIKEKFNL